MFKQELLNEIARCINVPYNVAAGNSAGYNYSSGRLDHKGYYGGLAIEQADCEVDVLDRIFRAWYAEARLVRMPDGSNYVPEVDLSYRPWIWAWDPPADIDPVKTSQARMIDLQYGVTSLPEIYAAKGIELKKAMQDQADALGLPLPELQKLWVQKIYGTIASGNADEMTARRRKGRGRKLFSRIFSGGKA